MYSALIKSNHVIIWIYIKDLGVTISIAKVVFATQFYNHRILYLNQFYYASKIGLALAVSPWVVSCGLVRIALTQTVSVCV